MQKTISITTDFGDALASSQLRAVLSSLDFKGNLIENHDISSFSIIEGAFATLLTAKFLPHGSVVVGVVDPGVGSDRAGVVLQTKNFWFVGPNNGLLYPAAELNCIKKVWKINENEIGDNIANTFHGRDVFIKIAAYLSQGKSPADFGCVEIANGQLTKLSFENGQVLHIDSYGNIKVNFDSLVQFGDRLEIGNFKIPVVKTFTEVSPGSLLAYPGSSGTLEIAVNLGNAAEMLKVKTEDILKIKIEKEKRVRIKESMINAEL